MEQQYSRLFYAADEDKADFLAGGLFSIGCEGIEERDRNEYIAFFRENYVDAGLTYLEKNGVSCQAMRLENRDWHSEWKKKLKPIPLTQTYWVAPIWALSGQSESKTILIEPKMAFGTGHHETTQMCAQYIEQLAPLSDSLLDVGTGSGLLAILGEKEKIPYVVALDNDPSITENLDENIRQNGCCHVLPFIGTLESLIRFKPFQLITANIISSVIIPMLPTLNGLLSDDGRLILSGLLSTEQETMRSLLNENEFDVVSEKVLGEWYAMELKKIFCEKPHCARK